MCFNDEEPSIEPMLCISVALDAFCRLFNLSIAGPFMRF